MPRMARPSRPLTFASILVITLAVALAVVTGAVAVPTASLAAPAADTCSAAWSSTTAYTKGAAVSMSGHNFKAKWWTKNESPMVNRSGVWDYLGDCGDGAMTASTSAAPRCSNATPWVVSKAYARGDLVSYPNGRYYLAAYANPGYDPVSATWFWRPYSCPSELPFTEEQFGLMFPLRNPLYTYQRLVEVMGAYPAFVTTGDETTRRRETAAFLANVNHETGGLSMLVESNTANYSNYCSTWPPYGCPAGRAAYYGRGPLQLTWNMNYKIAGEALGVDLLNDPWLLERDGALAWRTAVWYWMTRRGAAATTPHDSMVSGAGFGQTIRSINGKAECDGARPTSVRSRVNAYLKFTGILRVTPGDGVSC